MYTVRNPRLRAIVAGSAVAVILGCLGSAATMPTARAATPDKPMAACQYEDSPGPCVWDARHMGNGEGSSFVRRPAGHVKYVSHKRAHKLLGLS